MVGLLLAAKFGKTAMRRLGRAGGQAVERKEAAVGNLPVWRTRCRLLDGYAIEHDMVASKQAALTPIVMLRAKEK
jgi:hypothetical protein